ncbi:MarR family winged helix-turn-helix transcriptional regulator [Pseudonocardia sp. CA-107938]|uniref:MarR family winged helix-turn-helix transcriptional regulator n=1 Tax=Pseudonocardia sp. CA-107938 TaxID=3240021 RepID=UPI003D8E82EE
MHDERLGNLLGAAALAVTDRMLAGVQAAGGVGASSAAALVALAETPGTSVTELGRGIGLSQPAAARMVDGLERAGLAARSPRPGRAVAVALTAAGERAVAEIRAARAAALDELVAVLDAAERVALTTVLERLLAALYAGRADVLCRLCDRACCVDGAVCPVGQAERDRAV